MCVNMLLIVTLKTCYKEHVTKNMLLLSDLKVT